MVAIQQTVVKSVALLTLGLSWYQASAFLTMGRSSNSAYTNSNAASLSERLSVALPKQTCEDRGRLASSLHRARGGQIFQRRAVAIPETTEAERVFIHTVDPPQVEEPKKGLLDSYLRALEKKPMRTKIITSGVICGIGDIMAQALMFKQRTTALTLGGFVGALELQRFSIYALLGAFWIAPIVHYWFDALESITKSPKGPPKTFVGRMAKALKMVMLDQSVGAPLVNAGMLFFFPFFSVIMGQGLGMGASKQAGVMVKNKLWGTMLTCWKVWPVANLINFAFVPAPLRVLFMNMVGLGWNIYLAGAVN